MATKQFKIAGKTALVTGAGKRIGRATALALADAGANVVVHYRCSAQAAAGVCRAVRQRGVQAWAFAENLSDEGAGERLFAQAADAAGPIDILVNNASVFDEDTLRDVTDEALKTSVQLHAVAPLALSRCMAAQGREGVIVNLLDARMVDYDRQHVSYHLSKRMLYALTRTMALEFAPLVRVNGIAPGLILPPEGKDKSYLEALASTNPLHTYGSLDAVTEALLFLLHSRFVTGQVIFVDGGRHLRGNVYE